MIIGRAKPWETGEAALTSIEHKTASSTNNKTSVIARGRNDRAYFNFYVV